MRNTLPVSTFIAPHKHGLYQDCVFITAATQGTEGGKCAKPDARRV